LTALAKRFSFANCGSVFTTFEQSGRFAMTDFQPKFLKTTSPTRPEYSLVITFLNDIAIA
jgi:hypothetical protein